MQQPQVQIGIAVFYALFSLVVLFLGYRVVRWVFRSGVRLLTHDSVAFGPDMRARLLGLGIAVLLFRGAPTAVIRSSLAFLFALFDQLPQELRRSWQEPRELCRGRVDGECLASTWFSLLDAGTRTVLQAFRTAGVANLPWAEILLMLAAWALAASALATFLPAPQLPAKLPAPRRGFFRRRSEPAAAAAEAAEAARAAEAADRARHQNTAGARRWLRWLRVAGRRITWVTRQNFLFFLLLFIGAYLSIAAIGAIPDLQAEPEELQPSQTAAALTTRLQGFHITADSAGGRDPLAPLKLVLCTHAALAQSDVCTGDASETRAASPTTGAGRPGPMTNQTATDGQPGTQEQPPGPTNPAGAAGTAQPAGTTQPAGTGQPAGTAQPPGTGQPAVPSAPAPGAAATPGDPRLPRLQVDTAVQAWEARTIALVVKEVDADRTERLRDYRAQIQTALEDLVSARDRANAAYELTVTGRSRRRVKDQYFYTLSEWYAGLMQQYRTELQSAHRRLQSHDVAVQRWADGLRGNLLRKPATTEPGEDWLGDAFEAAFSLTAPQPAASSRQRVPFPERPSPGYGLGPFQAISGWLLGTESLALAMITGMLGFGLLGAAASTFVRDQVAPAPESGAGARGKGEAPQPQPGDAPRPNQPLVKDLPGVIIRGGAAAIVVFLGVMGGLAIFSVNDNPRPNAYVLLFTCLAGAVFSERVWKWAEEKLGTQLQQKDGGGQKDGKGGAAAAGTSRLYVIVTSPGEEVVVLRGDKAEEATAPAPEAPARPKAAARARSAPRRRGAFWGRVFGRRRRPTAEPPDPPAAPDG